MKKIKALIIYLIVMAGLLSLPEISRADATTVTALEGGCVSNYQLPYLEYGLFGATLIFSEELNQDGKDAVEAALTAGSDKELTYRWGADANVNKLRISIGATETATFDADVVADVTDTGNWETSNLLLIDTQINSEGNEIWVDDDYNSDTSGWGITAFATIQEGLDAVSECGTVNVASGTYEESDIIYTKGVSLVGPEGGNDPATILNDCGGEAIVILSIDATVSNLYLLQTNGGGIDDEYCNSEQEDGEQATSPTIIASGGANFMTLENNEIAGGDVGVELFFDSSSSILRDNDIHDNEMAGILDLGYGAQTISDNTLENNTIGIYFQGMGPIGNNLGGTVISDNHITSNSLAGILYTSGNQTGPINIGPDNNITGNGAGIFVGGDAYNLHINGNQILNNSGSESGLHVEDATTGLDATGNWWGPDEPANTISTGPSEENYNPDGNGDVITIVDSYFIYFRPFCLDSDCHDLSSVEVEPADIDILFDNGGSITPDLVVGGGSDADILVTSLTVNEETVIKIPVGDANNAVVLPRGTVITKTDGGNFDAADLTAADITLSELSGFAIDETLLGAMQWGIPSLGLSFSQPITIYIYVGTDLSGRTLVIKRSTSASEGWTDDGIVAPRTCTVSSEGFCSFETTKASYYSVLDDPDFAGEEKSEKAKITSWEASLYEKPDSKCAQRLKLEIEGKHFDKKAEVRIGGREASSVNRKSSKEITAKFCLEKLLDVKTDPKRTISVTNPDADTEKADKKINLSSLTGTISTGNVSQGDFEWVKNIQGSLVKLGYLDAQYITGIYGSITTEAVKKFQGDNGIEQTGTVGPLTKAKLVEKLQ